MSPFGAGEAAKYMSEENGSLDVTIGAKDVLGQNISPGTLRVLRSVGLNPNWS